MSASGNIGGSAGQTQGASFKWSDVSVSATQIEQAKINSESKTAAINTMTKKVSDKVMNHLEGELKLTDRGVFKATNIKVYKAIHKRIESAVRPMLKGRVAVRDVNVLSAGSKASSSVIGVVVNDVSFFLKELDQVGIGQTMGREKLTTIKGMIEDKMKLMAGLGSSSDKDFQECKSRLSRKMGEVKLALTKFSQRDSVKSARAEVIEEIDTALKGSEADKNTFFEKVGEIIEKFKNPYSLNLDQSLELKEQVMVLKERYSVIENDLDNRSLKKGEGGYGTVLTDHSDHSLYLELLNSHIERLST